MSGMLLRACPQQQQTSHGAAVRVCADQLTLAPTGVFFLGLNVFLQGTCTNPLNCVRGSWLGGQCCEETGDCGRTCPHRARTCSQGPAWLPDMLASTFKLARLRMEVWGLLDWAGTNPSGGRARAKTQCHCHTLAGRRLSTQQSPTAACIALLAPFHSLSPITQRLCAARPLCIPALPALTGTPPSGMWSGFLGNN